MNNQTAGNSTLPIFEHICQFIPLADINDRGFLGKDVGCPICGEIRSIYQNGKIIITHKAWKKAQS